MSNPFVESTFRTIEDYIPAQIDPFIPVIIDGLTRNQIRDLLYGYIHQIMDSNIYIHRKELYVTGQTSEYDYSMEYHEVPGTRRTISRFIRCICQDNHVFDYIF